MTSIRDRIRRVGKLLIRVPSIGLASLIYSGIIYLASLRAGLLDPANPWWVLTAASIVLLSPLYHAFVISRTAAAAAGSPFSLRDVPLESFGTLVAAQLLINALAALGATMLLLPGIYIGLRTIYYKQMIILRKHRSIPAMRESFAITGDWRTTLQLFLILVIAYGFLLGVDWLLGAATEAGWVDGVAILVSTLFLAWVNVYITLLFEDLVGGNPTTDES
jgi:hypothetical protein